MKQVWILNHYAQEPRGSGGTRHFHLAKYLQGFGWQATIFAASVDHVSGAQRLTKNERRRLEIFHGVKFLWVKTPVYKNSGVSRIFNMLVYTWQTLRSSTSSTLKPPDIIIGSSVHPFAAMAGALLAKQHKVPFIFEVRDLWPQTLIEMGRLHNDGFLAWILRKLEYWLYSQAARTIVLLPQAWQYIAKLGFSKESVIYIPNGVDLSLYHPTLITKNSEKNNFFTLMYFGSHGRANGLEILLLAMQLVQKMPRGKRIRLRLIGDGPLKPSLKEKGRALGLENVEFEAAVPKNQIPALANQADAFIIVVLDLPQLYRYGVSMNKIFDYMAAERPVVIMSGASNNPIDEAKAGLTVPPGQIRELADAIICLASKPLKERRKMGKRGRSHVEKNYDFKKLAKKLANVLNDVHSP
jgi:glycosyltransferase involved in cell wall biosynthesis